MIASLFITAGVDVLRNPESRAAVAHKPLEKVRSVAPGGPGDVTAVRLNAASQVAGAAVFAFGKGKAARAAAAVLAASLVPTTLAGHAFWEADKPEARQMQFVHFAKNLAILGGLILAALGPEDDD
jgi:uncharacterized membrane protein YphA (DoxX/SURF4 family)